MKNIIDISTGEVKMGAVGEVLVSNGIGSCIVIAGINLEKEIGTVAHIMLPGKAPATEKQLKTKYAIDAVDRLLQLLQLDSDDTSHVKTCLVGGANVLKKQDDTICESNINSIQAILKKLRIRVDAQSLGGTDRRSLHFDIENREVYITEGDSALVSCQHPNNAPSLVLLRFCFALKRLT